MLARGGASGTGLLPRRPPGRAPPPPRCRFPPLPFPPPPPPPPHRHSSARPRTWLPGASSEDEPRPEPPGDGNGAIANPQGSPGRTCTGLARRIVLAPSGARDRLRAAVSSRCCRTPLSRTGWYNLRALWPGRPAPQRDIVRQRGHLFRFGFVCGSRLPPRGPSFTPILANSPRRRPAVGRSVPRSPAIATGVTEGFFTACAPRVRVYVENGLRDASAVGSSVRPVRWASRVRSTAAAASGQGERRGG